MIVLTRTTKVVPYVYKCIHKITNQVYKRISEQTRGKPKTKTFISYLVCKKQTTLNAFMRWHKFCMTSDLM